MTISQLVEKMSSKYPSLRYSVTDHDLAVTAQTPTSFDVTFHGDSGAYSVSFGGWHEDFQDDDEAARCFLFGLSRDCRLRVLRRGRMDYKWVVQHQVDGRWCDESTCGLLFIPFWLPKQERILQNEYDHAA
jgi:uncharacterized ParB-like nuclease family protein